MRILLLFILAVGSISSFAGGRDENGGGRGYALSGAVATKTDVWSTTNNVGALGLQDQIAFGVALIFIQRKALQYLNILGLCFLTVGAIFSDLMIFTLPFNPFSLNISMIALSMIAILNFSYLPKASNCITKQK